MLPGLLSLGSRLDPLMPRTTRHNRQESLEKALALFWRKGFHATSLKDLEATLDMRPGSIYAAFGSKEQLFQEALERYAQRALVELDRTLGRHESALDGLAAYLRQLGGLRERELPCRACMLVKSLLELGDREAAAREKVDALLEGMEARFIERFDVARDRGEIGRDQDLKRLGRRLQAEVMGLRSFAQRDIGSDALQALAEDLARSVEALGGGRGAEAPRR